MHHWRYKVIRQLGEGGQARVYLAEDLADGRQVALKCAGKTSAGDLVSEFIRLFRLRHYGLPEVFDFYRMPEHCLMAMEYFQGVPLGRALSGPEESWIVWSRVVKVVSYLHQNGYVHGDLKPENVLVNNRGEIRLLDLGLLVLSSEASRAWTPAYAAPEVISGYGSSGPESDVYSLGLMLYEMLEGEVPGREQRMRQDSGWTEKLGRFLPPERAEIVSKALSYWPHQRFTSAVNLLEAIGISGSTSTCSASSRMSGGSRPTALSLAIKKLEHKASGILPVEGPPGSGKTCFLKELNFVFQLSGRCSVYLDADEGDLQKVLEIVPGDCIVLIDNLDREGPGQYRLQKFQKVVASFSRPAAPEKDDPGAVRLEGITGTEHQRMISKSLQGLIGREVVLLATLLERRYGGNGTLALAGFDYARASGLIRTIGGNWRLDWPALYRLSPLAGGPGSMVARQWAGLNDSQRDSLKTKLAGGAAGSKLIGAGLEFWLDKDGRIKGEALKEFIYGQYPAQEWGRALDRDEGESIEASTALWTMLEKLGLWERWTSCGLELFRRSDKDRDLEGMLFYGDSLLKKGTLKQENRIYMVPLLLDLCGRVSRWDLALELVADDSGPGTDSLQRRLTRARLLANQGRLAEAQKEAAAAEGLAGGDEDKWRVTALKGWLDSLDGRGEQARQLMQHTLEATTTKAISGTLLFEIYDRLARTADRLSDYFKAAQMASLALNNEDNGIDIRERARMLNLASHARMQLKEFEEAERLVVQSLKILDDGMPDDSLAYAWANYGMVSMALNKWEQAYQAFRTAGMNLRGTDTGSLAASITANLAFLDNRSGRYQAARMGYLSSAAKYRELNDFQGELICLANTALKDHLLGRTEYAQKSLVVLREQALSVKQGYAAWIICKDLGQVLAESGRYHRALEPLGQARELAREQGRSPGSDVLFYGALASVYSGIPGLRDEYLSGTATDQPGGLSPAQSGFLQGLQAAMEQNDEKGVAKMVSAGEEMKRQGDGLEAAKAWLASGELALEKGMDGSLDEVMPALLNSESEFAGAGAPEFRKRAQQAIVEAARRLYAGPGAAPGAGLLEGLYQLASLLEPGRRQTELAQSCLDLAVRLMGAERGGLFLMDDNQQLSLAAKTELDPATQQDALEFSSKAVLAASQKGELIISNDAQLDQAFSHRLSIKRNAIRSLMCVPVRSREGTLGAIYLDSRLRGGLFNGRQREFMKALAGILGAVLESSMLFQELRRHQEEESGALSRLVGGSAAVRAMTKRIRAAAPADVTVLLSGESGTGKGLAARSIHELSARRRERFLALDCGSLPETLLESELFGYVRGAFTGAARDKAGLFEAADGGTVFLDEIASASPGVQARLLRVIESGEVRRLGSDAVVRVNVRLICATNRDLEVEINENRFREDLYYRLKVIKIDIPPLRERGGDVLLLAEFFKNAFQKTFHKGRLQFSPGAKSALTGHLWPGNIRELENTVKKAVLLCQDKVITERDLELESLAGEEPRTLKQENELGRRAVVSRVLEEAGYNTSKAADKLGVTSRHLRRMMVKYDIKRTKMSETGDINVPIE